MAIRKHDCWTVGSNINGQQGIGQERNRIFNLTLIKSMPFDDSINDIVTGYDGATYFRCDENKLLVCGNNEYGQLGISHEIVEIINHYWFKPIIPLDIMYLIAHYSFHTIKKQFSIMKIKDMKIRYISGGIYAQNRFVISKTDNTVYGVGWNMFKQLGMMEKYIKHHKPIHVEWTQIYYFSVNKIILKQIESALMFTIFLSDTGNIYVVGKSLSGGLGFGKLIPELKQITFLNTINTQIEQIKCGYAHTLAVEYATGSVWSWGANYHCELGYRSAYMYDLLPSKVNLPMLTKVIQMGCGENHSILLDEGNRVCCFGRNDLNQCLSDMVQCVFPILKKFKTTSKIIEIKAGRNHNVAKTDNNEFYLWGSNGNCECFSYDVSDLVSIKKARRLQLDMELDIVSVIPGFDETRIITLTRNIITN